MITSSGSRTGLPNSNESERNIQRLVDTSIEVDSSDDVAFVEVLDSVGRGLGVQFSFVRVARRCLHKALSHLAKEDLNVKSGSEGSSRGGPSTPW